MRTMSYSRLFTAKHKLWSLLLLASIPLMTGCDTVTLAGTTFGAGLWLDIALTPIRSLLGAFALNTINTF